MFGAKIHQRWWALNFSLLLALAPLPALAQKPLDPMTVTIINADANHWFWQTILDVMRKAATDLGIKLEIIDTVRDHLLYRKMALDVFARNLPPDYLIIGNEKESAAKIIDNSNQARTKVFLFNNGFVSAENKSQYAQPRARHPQWIGQLIPDNFQAGYDVTVKLIETLQRTYPDQDLQLLGLAGSFNTHASIDRERGFLAAAAKYPKVKVMQTVSAEWNGTIAESKTYYLLHRYPKVVGVWAANDEMAEGAMRGAEKHKRIPGKDIFFTGCGWSATGVGAVLEKRMVASAGGHFLDGAWALARLYDYHHKIDELVDLPQSKFVVMDATNVERLSAFMKNRRWMNFDFKKWTKVFNPRLKNYEETARLLLSTKGE